MMRPLILAALLLAASPALAQVPPMPDCKSGWKLDALFAQRQAYIPLQYEAGVAADAAPGTEIVVRDMRGSVVVTVRRGQEIKFDCFDGDKDRT